MRAWGRARRGAARGPGPGWPGGAREGVNPSLLFCLVVFISRRHAACIDIIRTKALVKSNHTCMSLGLVHIFPMFRSLAISLVGNTYNICTHKYGAVRDHVGFHFDSLRMFKEEMFVHFVFFCILSQSKLSKVKSCNIARSQTSLT